MQDKCPIYLGICGEVVIFPLHFYCVNLTSAFNSIFTGIVFHALRPVR